ncbi:MAG: hypothetical protein ABIO51_00470 [Solirubrobacteraceae bacterium]
MGELRTVPMVMQAPIGPATTPRLVAAGSSAAGTAYLAATEADVHPVYRDRIIEADGTDTELTELFDIGWPNAPHRVLRNETFEAWSAAGSPPAPNRPGEGDPVATRDGRTVVRYSDEQPTRNTEGDIEAMALYAGVGVGAIARVEDAATITERLLAATGALRAASTPSSVA